MAALKLLMGVLCAATAVESAGITVHTEVGKRAMDLYESDRFGGDGEVRRILEENQDAFQAGIPFPDFFYNPLCGDHGDVAEDSHWGPYLAVAADYFRETYPVPFAGDKDAEKLFAFIFGIATHQASDTSWHALEGLSQGIMEMLSQVEFDGDFDAAHNMLDIGGDIAGAYLFETDFATEWYIPSVDLYNILVLYRGDDDGLTPADFAACGAFEHLLRGIEHLEVAALIYPPVVEKSPTMIDELETYVTGGVGDMTSWTRLTWDTLARMLEVGTGDCDITDNPMTITCDPEAKRTAKETRRRTRESSKSREVHARMFQKLAGVAVEDTVDVRHTERGAYVSVKTDNFRAERRETSVEFSEEKASRANVLTTLYSSRPYSEFGYSAARLGATGLVVGAPGYSVNDGDRRQGCVFVFEDVTALPAGAVAAEDVAHQLVCEERDGEAGGEYARFGHSVAVADADGNGLDDIVVGAPHTDSSSFEYDGAVFVYYNEATDPNVPAFSHEPDESVGPEGPGTYGTFGWSLEVVDGNRVAVGERYLVETFEQRGRASLLDLSDFSQQDLSNYPEESYTWFGHSLAHFIGEDEQDGAVDMVAVGSPISAYCGSPSSQDGCPKAHGKVSVFITDGNIIADLYGNEDLEKFGYAVKGGTANLGGELTNVLLIGAPVSSSETCSHCGAVYVYLADDILARGNDATPVAKIDGEVEHGRFGYQLTLTDDPTDPILLVGSPRFTDGSSKEPGAVFAFSDLLEGNGDPVDFVEGEAELSFFGGGAIQQVGDNLVVVGAPADGGFGVRRGGSVSLLQL